jgi:hypothetical protein
MARGDALPASDEIARWIKPRLLGKDDDGQVILDGKGCPSVVSPAAFELGQDEDSLSVTWLQFFGYARVGHLPAAAEAIRASMESKTLQAKGAFAIGSVHIVLATGRDYGVKLRILEDPVEGNDGHAEIRRYPRELGLLQIALARNVFAERHLYAQVRQVGWTPPS